MDFSGPANELIATIVGVIATIILGHYVKKWYNEKYKTEPKLELEEAQPEKHGDDQVQIKTNLTRADHNLISRQEDLENLETQLLVRKRRLVTIVGTGGLGKTSLAREFAVRYKDSFPGGIWFIDLTSAKTAIGVAHEIRTAFEKSLNTEQSTSRDLALQILKSKGQTLFILDNFEQI